ncbi:MAG: alpha-mannosidase [Oscillospiraceae bacterium]|jgi:alpha-mannosidase|nr:alpha-mannosidase [Oscillospiraceae bacterium]
MYFSKERILLNKIEQIGASSALASVDLPEWETTTGFYHAPGEYTRDEGVGIIRVGERWTCADGATRWFRTRVAIPQGWEGRRVVLALDFGGEALVRVNGKVQSAVTSYLAPSKQQRERVALADRAVPGASYDIEAECALNYMEFMRFRAQGMRSIDYTFRKAKLEAVDEIVESFYFDCLAAYEALDSLTNPYDRIRRGNVKLPRELAEFLTRTSKDTYYEIHVREALLAALSMCDVDMGRDTLAASIPAAAKTLKDALAAIPDVPRGKVLFTGHAHIDTAWLWPCKESVRKAAKTFANALALMDQYPKHVFCASQPWQYDQIKKHYPELFEKIKLRVAQGRWELVGNSWVEADANVPSGESLVRQILYGRDFFIKEFGACSDVYWMPDVFGYSWSLPQIILRSGMKYFYTSKLINNDVNRFPHTVFLWQGVDGSQTPAYLERMNYNGEIDPKHLAFLWHDHDEKAVCGTLFQTFGWGDGGGGPTYQMLEFADRLEQFPGLPEADIGRASDFFAGIPTERLPVWNDEMYYEFHRGTYTSQARTKRNNRKCELLARQSEMLCAMAWRLLGAPYPMDAITDAWKTILLNQFHDIIPGSSIHDVYEDCDRDYAAVSASLSARQDAAAAALADAVRTDTPSVVVFNPLSWSRSSLVSVRLPSEYAGFTAGSASTVENGTLTFQADDAPAMGYKVFPLVKAPVPDVHPVSVSPRRLENEALIITLDARGLITSVWDKTERRELLRAGGLGNLMTVYEDKPERESAWNIDVEYKNKFWDLTQAQSIRVAEDSPVRGAVEIVRKFNRSTLTQRIALYPAGRRVDFETRVDWQETEKMLKAAFDVEILSSKASYEIAYGAIERPTHTNTLWDEAKFEVPAHKWADLSEGGYGAAILNDCKYGYDIHGHTMRITLLRSPVYPDPAADKGLHDFTYSLLPHAGGWREADVAREAYSLNVPLHAVLTGAHAGALPEAASALTVDSPGAIVETLKQSQDGQALILRLYESKGCRGPATVSLGFPVSRVCETNLVETPERDIPLSAGAFTVPLAPFEIKTFRLE